jgi:hypothetical protein
MVLRKWYVVFSLIALGCHKEKPKPADTFTDALRDSVNDSKDLPRFVFLFDPRNKEKLSEEDFVFLSKKLQESVQKNVFDRQARLCLEILGQYKSFPVGLKDALRKDIMFLVEKDPEISTPNGGSLDSVYGIKVIGAVGNADDIKWLSKMGNKGDLQVQKAVVDAISKIKKGNG